MCGLQKAQFRTYSWFVSGTNNKRMNWVTWRRVGISALDANSDYYQIGVVLSDSEKTVFISHHGLYQLIRVLFGSNISLATFQRVIDVCFSTVKWPYDLLYLDYTVIFLRTLRKHSKHAILVLRVLKEACVTLKVKTWAFFTNKTDHPRHIICTGPLGVPDCTYDAIRDLKLPAIQTEVLSFIGLCHVFQRFFSILVRIRSPEAARLPMLRTGVKTLGSETENSWPLSRF